MEFRPLLEMTPEQLEPQVEMELNEECHSPSQDDQRHTNGDATSKILQRWERVGSILDSLIYVRNVNE